MIKLLRIAFKRDISELSKCPMNQVTAFVTASKVMMSVNISKHIKLSQIVAKNVEDNTVTFSILKMPKYDTTSRLQSTTVYFNRQNILSYFVISNVHIQTFKLSATDENPFSLLP